MKNFLFFGALSAIVFVGCCWFFGEKTYTEKEIFRLMETVGARAIAQNDLAVCETLPVKAMYRFDMSSDIYTSNPRGRCYWEFVQKTKQEEACQALDDLEDATVISGSECYEYLAQVQNDISFCSKMKERGHECQAKVLKSIDPCYELEKDEHDVSKYPRSVKYCISAVALRLWSIDPCLEINGPDYGDQWRVGRNECIMNVASLLKLKGEGLASACEKMVDDEDGWDYKERCSRGGLTGNIEQLIPPYGPGLGF